MENNFHEALQSVQTNIGRELQVDQEALKKDYFNDRQEQSMTIKVLSILGGILASVAFVGFIFITRLNANSIFMSILSGLFFVTSIAMNKRFDKVILDTISVCMYLLSFASLGILFDELNRSSTIPYFCFLGLALLTILISRSYILTFVATLITTGSLLAIFFTKELAELNHVLLVSLAAIIIYFTFNEGKLMKIKSLQGKRYLALRTGLVFSFMICLYYTSEPTFIIDAWLIDWITSGIFIGMILWLINCLLNRFLCEETGKKIFISLLILICLGFTAMNPAISGSLFLLLISFKVNYKTGISLGVLAFIYFIGLFYYDLDLSLLKKSIAMFVSGVFFLLLYFVIFKKSNSHEKV